MATIKTAIDLNTGRVLNTASPAVFGSREANKDNFFPIEVDEEGNFQVENRGTAIAPCALTIVPKTDVFHFTVEGLSEQPLSFTGVKAGQTLVLNGEKREITLNGKDAMENFDGWEFPRLKPGVNKIKINDAMKMFISIAYNPRFI